MKFNKWTLGLAAVGVVSLASAVKAEERASAVMTALSSTTLSGYVDTSAQWNIGNGNENSPPYKFGGPEKADGFNLNVVQLRLEKPLDESEWAAGYRVDLWFGPDANTLNTQNGGSTTAFPGRDFAVRQAYVALRAPVGNGIDFKVGVFDSIIGYESVESPSNPNFTRSYGHSIEPQTHTGVLASYRFSDLVSATVGIANTVGPIINNRAFDVPGDTDRNKAESYKTYMASLAFTAPSDWGFLSGSSLYAGIVNGFNDNEVSSDLDQNTTSYYVGATLATPIAGLRLGGSFDFLDVHNSNDQAWAIAGYASYQATEKLSLHARGEYLRDSTSNNGPMLFSHLSSKNQPRVLALTGTIQYDLWKNVISRLEARWDHSFEGEQFGADGSHENYFAGHSDNAYVLLANIIYKF
ncbi:MAG: outer membrane beta-barrel protein [Verrucomicrobia bacterium]|nr:outer membrane beta-barrel protein [Verrucomicrobiota bacterium]